MGSIQQNNNEGFFPFSFLPPSNILQPIGILFVSGSCEKGFRGKAKLTLTLIGSSLVS